DYREGLVTYPSGYDLSLLSGGSDVGTRDNRKGHFLSEMTTRGSPANATYWFGSFWEPRRATFLMEGLLAEGRDDPAVWSQAARLWTNMGLQYYLRGTIPTDDGLVYIEQNRRLTAAWDAWRRAAELMPDKRDCGFYLGM